MMKNFKQTLKQKRVAITANKTCFVNSRKQVWQPKDASHGADHCKADSALRLVQAAMLKRLGW